MRIGVVGAGLMGSKLGTLLARAGHEVLFSYSHSMRKLERLATKAGNGARAATVAEAGEEADALLLAVHWNRVADVRRQLGNTKGLVLISCSLPMKRDDSSLAVGFRTSGAEELAKKFSKAHVVSAFGTVPSEVLYAVFAGRRRKRRPSLVYCGADPKAKSVAAVLIRDLGFEPMDVGGLESARFFEPFAMMVASMAYRRGGNPALAYRFEEYEELKGK